jgi:hypothetical protein
VGQWEGNDAGVLPQLTATFSAVFDQSQVTLTPQCASKGVPSTPETRWFTASGGTIVFVTEPTPGEWDVSTFVKH